MLSPQTTSLDLLSIPEAADRASTSSQALLAKALRLPDQLPILIDIQAPGWPAVALDLVAGTHDEVEDPWAIYGQQVLFCGLVRLGPSALRQVAATRSLPSHTPEAPSTLLTLRQYRVYASWSISGGQATVDPSSAVTKSVDSLIRLTRTQPVPLEALLVPTAALGTPEPGALDVLATQLAEIRQLVLDQEAKPLISVTEAARLLGKGNKATRTLCEELGALVDIGGERGTRVLRQKLLDGLASRAGRPVSAPAPEQTFVLDPGA